MIAARFGGGAKNESGLCTGASAVQTLLEGEPVSVSAVAWMDEPRVFWVQRRNSSDAEEGRARWTYGFL